jgi:hypothetical protein
MHIGKKIIRMILHCSVIFALVASDALPIFSAACQNRKPTIAGDSSIQMIPRYFFNAFI